MRKNEKLNTIGEARQVSKTLAEIITKGTDNHHLFMIDDNIRCWDGVTLINDPNPMFRRDPDPRYSQLTNISLLTVLNYCLHDKVDAFPVVGFCMRRSKNDGHRKNAYGRKHVFGAVLLNLQKLSDIQYNPIAWAMEDVSFNWEVDKLWKKSKEDGVIIKCLRFIAHKEPLNEGGVKPIYPDGFNATEVSDPQSQKRSYESQLEEKDKDPFHFFIKEIERLKCAREREKEERERKKGKR